MARGGDSLLRRLLRDRAAFPAAIVLSVMLFAGICAPWIVPQDSNDPGELELWDSLRPPIWSLSDDDEPQRAEGIVYLLGTDDQGRDMLSAILLGLRVSLLVGFSVVAISSVTGTTLGIIAGYVGGRVEMIIMRIADITLSFPSILVALFILSLWKEGGLERVIIAICSVRWVAYARTSRGCTLSEKEKDYVTAARALGQRPIKIMFRHIFPNVLSPLAIIAAVEIAMVIMLEATLSFLGVGTPITEPSLGMLIKNGYEDLLSGNWWITVFPGLALVALVFSINVLVDWLRDTLNPHLAAAAGARQRAE
ncbi:ABC transporter permease [Candidatus Sumerlaeota bacterium]|nr:ABC transporter permease [Candidatus Sumerlaeota bacterium]